MGWATSFYTICLYFPTFRKDPETLSKEDKAEDRESQKSIIKIGFNQLPPPEVGV